MNREAVLTKKYLSGDAAKAIGIQSNALARWVDRGLVRPSSPTAGGSGTRNEYTLNDIVRIGIMKALGTRSFTWGRASDLAFQSPVESEYGKMLDEAITKSLDAWMYHRSDQRKNMLAEWAGSEITQEDEAMLDATNKPEPSYFFFLQDESGKVYASRSQNAKDFGTLYKDLETVESASLVNLSAIIDKVMCVLAGC